MVNSGNSTFNLPNLNVKDSEKTEEWHKKFVQAITSSNVNNTYSLNYATMNECVNFYQGLNSGDEFNFLQEAEDGDVLPAQWINYNKIKVKIDLLLGELYEKGYTINVSALNKEAKSRKLKEKERMRVEMRLQPVAQQLEDTYGMPMQQEGFIPADEEQLDDFFENDYKEQSELVMEAALKYLAKRNKWDYERLALFRDLLIMGKCFAKSEIVNGIPKIRRIDPRLMIYDTNAKDDYLSDAAYFGEVYYMTIAECAERYNLTRKQLQEVHAQYKQYNGASGATGGMSDFAVLGGNSNLKFFKNEQGELRVLVISAVWQDYKDYSHKYSTDKYGGEHIKRVSGDSTNEDVKKIKIKTWRQGTLIGGKFLKEWGEIPNQPRSLDNLAETKPPYYGLIPNYLNGHGISKVYQLKGLQKLKDIAMYNLQLAMARAGAKGFVYDVSQVPDEWDIHTVIKYLKTVGIAFIDSKKDGTPAQFNQFAQIDMTLSQSVQYYLEISMNIDREMDAVSGINEARQGQIQGSRQTVGVTQSSLFQSNLSTAVYFREFQEYASDLLNHQAGLVKIAWAGKERFAPIIGETGIDFLETDIELELNDYGVFVEEVPPMLDNVNTFHQLVTAALQAGQVTFPQAMKLLMEKDLKVAVRKMERDIEKQMQEQQEREQAMMQQQMEAQQAQMQQEEQSKTMERQSTQDHDKNMEMLESVNRLKEILAKNRGDLAGKKIDALKELEKAQKEKKEAMK